MEIKDLIRQGSEWLKAATEKMKDADYREETLQKAAEKAGEAAAKLSQATEETVKRAKTYIDENRIAPGAKDKYIQELEEELVQKDKEIRVLKRKLALKGWKK